jgi:ferredoxin-nitrite reductase
MSEATAEIEPNFAAVKSGAIPITPQERVKLEKDGLDVIHDIYRYSKLGFKSIAEDDFDRMKWYGVYRQKPKESGYFMLRIKLPGGQLNAVQATKLSLIADEFAHGFCDITTRQTIQFHWLRIEDVPTIFAQLAAVGIITSGACGDDTRNVTGCPVAGIDPHEIIDATPQLHEISRRLTNNRNFSNLPRKYKISVGGCHIQCTQPDINCVGVFGLTRHVNGTEEIGFGVKVGGGLSAAPHMAQVMPVFLKPEEVGRVVEAITCVYRDHGYRHTRSKARFKFLVADWGAERVTREVEAILGYRLTEHHDFEIPRDQETDHVGISRQKEPGMYYVGVCFAGGRLRSGQLETLGSLVSRFAAKGRDAIRLTNKQNAILLNIPEANLADLKKALDDNGLVYDPSNFRKGCVSCTGIEFCNLAVAETKNRMIELVGQLEEQCGHYKDKIRIHFSGCPSSCGQHQIADIGFRGARTKVNGVQVDAFDMFLGGRLGHNRKFNELIKGKILASEVHLAVDKVLRFFESKKTGDESFAEFYDRTAKDDFKHLFEESKS